MCELQKRLEAVALSVRENYDKCPLDVQKRYDEYWIELLQSVARVNQKLDELMGQRQMLSDKPEK